MKPWLTIVFVGLVGLCTALPSTAQEQARQYLSALGAYKAGNYQAAIEGLEQIAQSGVRSGGLYYNLGNAYLKHGELGPAILWYERAVTLIPNDPDLRFNLDYARSLTKDAVEETSISLVRIFFFWKYQISKQMMIVLAIGGNLVFWCLAVAWRITGKRILRRMAMVVLIPSVICILTAGFNFYESANLKLAIILPQEAPIRSGWEETSVELFVLHAGAKVRVVKSTSDHLLIQFAEDKMGWINSERIGLI